MLMPCPECALNVSDKAIYCPHCGFPLKPEKLPKKMKGKNKMFEKIKELIAEELGADAATITAETSFKDDLHADSLDLFELAMAFEEEFSVEIPSEDLEQITTVADVMNYLTEHQA